MTDAVFEQVNEATDQAPQPDPVAEQVKAEKEIIGKISLPKTITRGVWRTYFQGRQASIDKDKGIDMPTAQYYGVLALIKSGAVHIVDLPQLEAIIAQPVDEVPLPIIGLLISVVAIPIEQSFNASFLAYLKA